MSKPSPKLPMAAAALACLAALAPPGTAQEASKSEASKSEASKSEASKNGAAADAPVSSRAVDRALERMHEELTNGLDIWSDHSSFDKAWVGATKNFRVLTTASYGTAIDIANGLETMLGHFHAVLGTSYTPEKPLRVFILPDRPEYNAFGEAHGEHHSSFYGSFFAPGHPERPVAVEWNDNPTLLRMQITHSVVHQFLHDAFPASRGRRAAWLEEGLAAYFTHYWDPAWTLSEYLRAKEDGRLLDLDKVLVEGIDRYGLDTEVRMLQLAIFFDYLLRLRDDTKTVTDSDGKNSGMFRDYLNGTLNGKLPLALQFSKLLINRKKLAEDFLEHDFGQ